MVNRKVSFHKRETISSCCKYSKIIEQEVDVKLYIDMTSSKTFICEVSRAAKGKWMVNIAFQLYSLDVFLEASEEALIASPGYPYHSSNSVSTMLWIVIGRPGTQIVAHVEGWMINSTLMIGSGYRLGFSEKNAPVLDSFKIMCPENTLTLFYEMKNYPSLGFIAHVTSIAGKICISHHPM